MSKTTTVLVRTTENIPSRYRGGVQFTNQSTAYELTDEQLKLVNEDAFLHVDEVEQPDETVEKVKAPKVKKQSPKKEEVTTQVDKSEEASENEASKDVPELKE